MPSRLPSHPTRARARAARSPDGAVRPRPDPRREAEPALTAARERSRRVERARGRKFGATTPNRRRQHTHTIAPPRRHATGDTPDHDRMMISSQHSSAIAIRSRSAARTNVERAPGCMNTDRDQTGLFCSVDASPAVRGCPVMDDAHLRFAPRAAALGRVRPTPLAAQSYGAC